MALLMVWYSFATESWILLGFIVLTLWFAPFRMRVRGVACRLRTELGFFDEELLEVPDAVRARLAAEIIDVIRSSNAAPTPTSQALARVMHSAWSGSSGRAASLGAAIALGIVYVTLAVPSVLLFWFSMD